MADPWDFSDDGITQYEQQQQRVRMHVEDYERRHVANLPISERDAARNAFIDQQPDDDRFAAAQAYAADIRAALDRAEDSTDPQALDRVCRLLWDNCQVAARTDLAPSVAKPEPLASTWRDVPAITGHGRTQTLNREQR